MTSGVVTLLIATCYASAEVLGYGAALTVV